MNKPKANSQQPTARKKPKANSQQPIAGKKPKANSQQPTARKKPKAKSQKLTAKKGLSLKMVDKHLKFVLFLAVLGVFYIWNSHYAERLVYKHDTLRKEVKTLKDKYYQKEADYESILTYTEISKYADTLGLKKLQRPPYKLDE